MKGNVYIKLPRAGLGNKLLVWAKGVVIAHNNNFNYYVLGWTCFQPGAWLRREKSKRTYLGSFEKKNYFEPLMAYLPKSCFDTVSPDIEAMFDGGKNKILVNDYAINDTMFRPLWPYKDLIHQHLYASITEKIRNELASAELPIIAVHIRRGDFLLHGQETSLAYFQELINRVRKTLGAHQRITVFTDAKNGDIDTLKSIENLVISNGLSDITELLLMSKARLIITSRSSTFSYWAAFLSNAKIILPESDWQKTITNQSDKELRWHSGCDGNTLKNFLAKL